MRPFLEETYDPICLHFPKAPRSQKAFSGCKYSFLPANLLQSPCRSNRVFPRARDNYIPKGEEADMVIELDANSSAFLSQQAIHDRGKEQAFLLSF